MPKLTPGDFVDNAISPGLTGLLPEDLSPFAAMSIFPTQPINVPSGSYYSLSSDDLQRVANDGLVDADDGVPLDDFGISSTTFETWRVGSRHKFTVDEAKKAAGAFSVADLKMRASMIQTLRKIEKRWFAAHFTTSVWATDASAPSTKWDADGSDPIGDVTTDLILPILNAYDCSYSGPGEPSSGLIGICGKQVFNALTHHDQFRDLASITLNGPLPATRQKIAAAMGLDDLIVSGAVEVTTAEDASSDTRVNIAADGFLVLRVSPGAFNPASPTAGVTLVYEMLQNRFWKEPKSDPWTTHAEAWASAAFVITSTAMGAFHSDVLT